MPQSAKIKDPTAELLRAAERAASRAYCPYSNFSVGAAVLASDGRIFEGCNVENASYGLAICAERVALFNAIASGAREIVKMAVFCPNAAPDSSATSMPCGACRQVMAELLSPDAEILISGVGTFNLETLLPHAFRLPTCS